jgi:hypothetical protein
MLALGVLIFSGLHLLRFARAVALWGFLAELLPISPLYLALSGLVWGLAGLILTCGLWQGRRWASRATLPAVLAYSLYYWLDRMILFPQGGSLNWPFDTALNIILLIVIAWILSRRNSKVYFGEMNDTKS